MPTLVTREHDTGSGKILQITLNRPEVYNCVNGETAQALLEVWERFRDDESLTVAVLHGSGERFAVVRI